jgi:serine protease inhibitor
VSFALQLFKNVEKKDFVISPISPQILLSYLVNGSKGKTKSEIKNAIQFEDSKQLDELITKMKSESNARELVIKNALFLQTDDQSR